MRKDELAKLDPARAALAKALHVVLNQLLTQASAELINESLIYETIERPPELAMGDYAFPCFRFAKQLRKKPDLIASELALSLEAQKLDFLAEIKTIGAFCNVTLQAQWVAKIILPSICDLSLFKKPSETFSDAGTRIMVEFSCPNTHKEFHVGHGRNICLGDAVVRLSRYAGYEVIAANYPGDEGAHIAKCLWFIKKSQEKKLPTVNQGPWLSQMYAGATRTLEAASDSEKEIFNQEISSVLKNIEKKNGEDYQLWQKTRQWSLDEFERIYQMMGVSFDQYFFESELSELSQEIVDDYLAKGVFVEDDGAIGIDLSQEKLGFMLVRKRDGNTLYATKDLALARRKFEQHDIERSVYVVASEQQLHFRQVFAALKRMGFKQAGDCFHLSYGLVVLPEGKMSSRAGTSVTFQALWDSVQEGLTTILQRYQDKPDWSEQDIKDTAHLLCLGAIKYGMLNADPNKNIVFNIEEWLSFEGNSGPYLMYSYARVQSILRKAEASQLVANELDSFDLLNHDTERDLLNHLHDFNLVASEAAQGFRPNHLLNHLYSLSRAFNRFYAQVSVLKADSPALAQQRLVLLKAYAATLRTGLELLGITPPERM